VILLAAAHVVVKVYPVIKDVQPSSSAPLAAVIVSGTVAILAAAASGYVLWRSTSRRITAENERQEAALEAERERQQTSLEEERRRLSATLEAEGRRLRERHSFERGERDREELRAILDGLAARLFEIWALVNEANLIATQHVIPDPRKDVAMEAYGPRLKELAGKMWQTSRDAADQVERLRLRLGRDAELLAAAATEVREASEGMATAIFEDELVYTPLPVIGAKLKQQFDTVRTKRAEFAAEAVTFTRAQLHSAAPPE
jgi:hypothetical protein